MAKTYTVRWTRPYQGAGVDRAASREVVGLRVVRALVAEIRMTPGMENTRPQVFNSHGVMVRHNGTPRYEHE